MCWSQITSFTVGRRQGEKSRDRVMSFCCITYRTWGAAHCSIQRFMAKDSVMVDIPLVYKQTNLTTVSTPIQIHLNSHRYLNIPTEHGWVVLANIYTSGNTHTPRCLFVHTPGEEDALYYIKVLHENVSLSFLTEAAYGVCDTQLDGTFEGGRGRLQTKKECVWENAWEKKVQTERKH